MYIFVYICIYIYKYLTLLQAVTLCNTRPAEDSEPQSDKKKNIVPLRDNLGIKTEGILYRDDLSRNGTILSYIGIDGLSQPFHYFAYEDRIEYM
jgi:hypothetical protein